MWPASPYGQDLYVGWTMWWRLSAVRFFWTMVKRYYQALTLRGSELHYGPPLRLGEGAA